MSILGKVNPATSLATVLYVAPAGRKPQVNVNAASVVDGDASFTIGLIKAADKAVSVVTVTDGGKYTAIPAVVIAGANTTAAAAAVATMRVVDATINAAGTGYALNQVLTVAGGTGTSATVRVDAIGASGDITALSVIAVGAYTALPAQTANAVTGGTGTLAKVNLFFTINTVSVTAGGNGYDPVATTVATNATGQVTPAALALQFTTTFEPLTDTYHPLTKLAGRGAVERTGIVLTAGDMIVVKSETPNSINFMALGYEDLA